VTVTGIDISHHNATPDFSRYDFVFHKATEGVGFVDNAYSSRVSLTRSLGIVTGVYHFMTMTDSAQAQVNHFNNVANIQPGDIVALDFENDGTWAQHTNGQIADMGNACARALEMHYPTNRVVVYCNRSAYMLGVRGRDGMWIASPGVTPTVPYVFWQYGGELTLDLDRGNFDTVNNLKEWAGMGDVERFFDDTANSVTNPRGEKQTVFEAIWEVYDAVAALSARVEALEALKGSFTITGSGTVGQ